MRLDLRHQIVERLVGDRRRGCARPAENRRAAAIRARGRTSPPRPATRPAPGSPRRGAGRGSTAPAGRARRPRRPAGGGRFRPAPPRPRTRRSARRRHRDRSRRADPCRRRPRCRRPAADAPRLNGQSTAKIAATVISANTNHSVIKRFPGGTALPGERRCAALHHRRQARQLTIAAENIRIGNLVQKARPDGGSEPSSPWSLWRLRSPATAFSAARLISEA